MLRAVEGHVLEKMGQSALTGLFKNGAAALGDIKIGHLRCLGGVGDVIGETVGQCAPSHEGV